MITADQLLAHAIGDYILQSDWMANEKTKRSAAAAAHAISYGLPFLWLSPSWNALAVIVVSHFVIDRWRLARFVVWLKNCIGPIEIFKVDSRESARRFIAISGSGEASFWVGSYMVVLSGARWDKSSATGYHECRPPFLAVWLLIIADNIIHIVINGLALRYL